LCQGALVVYSLRTVTDTGLALFREHWHYRYFAGTVKHSIFTGMLDVQRYNLGL